MDKKYYHNNDRNSNNQDEQARFLIKYILFFTMRARKFDKKKFYLCERVI